MNEGTLRSNIPSLLRLGKRCVDDECKLWTHSPPASIRRTLNFGSSERRLATVEPPGPAGAEGHQDG